MKEEKFLISQCAALAKKRGYSHFAKKSDDCYLSKTEDPDYGLPKLCEDDHYIVWRIADVGEFLELV